MPVYHLAIRLETDNINPEGLIKSLMDHCNNVRSAKVVDIGRWYGDQTVATVVRKLEESYHERH